MFFSAEKLGFYTVSHHGADMPLDAVEITLERYDAIILALTARGVLSADADGLPILIDPPPHIPSTDELCTKIDTAADTARRAVAGDPLRAEEYKAAAAEAQTFAAANYQGDVPPMVAAWAINGRTGQQAADDILREAAQYNAAMVQLRTVRLNAKELVRQAMLAGDVEHAQDIAAETIASIQAAVAGIGNNA
jgi:hypothetical protein